MDINHVVKEAHDNAKAHGFYDDINTLENFMRPNAPQALHLTARRDFVLSQLSKVGGEVGEAVDVIQHGGIYDEKLESELADIIIRVADLCGYLRVDLDHAVAEKMRINKARPYKHGKLC